MATVADLFCAKLDESFDCTKCPHFPDLDSVVLNCSIFQFVVSNPCFKLPQDLAKGNTCLAQVRIVGDMQKPSSTKKSVAYEW